MTRKPVSIFILLIIVIVLTTAMSSAASSQTSAEEPGVYYFPFFINFELPLTSNSYYMITVNNDLYSNLGKELGKRDLNTEGAQDSVVILDFGYPTYDEEDGYGTDLFGYGPVGLDEIEECVKDFALAYFKASGTDVDSNVVIGVGTNNKGTSIETKAIAVNHGLEWAEMVNEINAWAVDEDVFSQVQVYGASDIEVAWNTVGWSRAWVDGYDQANQYPLLHFGDAAGCPYADGSTSTTCGNEWTLEDVWYVSWGSGASLPLPLIYLTNGVHAKQWANLSRYSVSQHGSPINFTGVLTQWQACEQADCKGTDNTPNQAYDQLYTELAKDPQTAQVMDWRTDIRWTLSSEIPSTSTSAYNNPPGSGLSTVQDEIEQLQNTLASVQLSTQMQSSLEEKLEMFERIAYQIEASRQNTASKASLTSTTLFENTDPPFLTGIIQGGMIAGLPYGVTINNTWQTVTDNGYVQVAAGSSVDDPNQGALYILLTALSKTEAQLTLVPAPENSGSFTILEGEYPELLIQSENGSTYLLDLTTLSLFPQDN
jgi:hypothetical protein